jgi:hypothetical protein
MSGILVDNMAEFTHSLFAQEQNVAQVAAYLRFLEGMQDFAERRREKEPVVAAFYNAALVAQTTIPAYEQLTRDYLNQEEVELTSYRVNKFFKAHQTLLLRDGTRYTRSYPENFHKSANWLEFLQQNAGNDEHPDYHELRSTLLLPDQKNSHKRAAAVAFAMRLSALDGVFGDFVVHEYGSSNGHVSKALALNDINPVRILDKEDGAVDRVRTAFFNLGGAHVPYARGYAIEAKLPKTQQDVDRIKAYTLKPSEVDGVAEETFDRLTLAQPGRRVHSVEGDFMDLSRRQQTLLRRDQADIVFLGHVLSQEAGQAEEVVNTLHPNVKSTGLFVINEYARVDPATNTLEIASDDWEKTWRCRTIVRQMRRWDEGYVPLITWETSDCERGVVDEEGLGRLALRNLPLL